MVGRAPPAPPRPRACRRHGSARVPDDTPIRMNRSLASIAPFAPLVGLGLGLVLACGGLGGGGRSGFSEYSGARYEPQSAEGYAALDAAYVVAPDSAAVAVTVEVQQATVALTSASLTSEITALEAAVSGQCIATVLDASPATRHGDGDWASSAEVRVNVDLRGLPGVAERRARIEACLAPIEPLLTPDGWSDLKTGVGRRHVRRSDVTLLLDSSESHRDALLKRAITAMNWSATAGGAPQLHPEDVRCVTHGAVAVAARRLSGLVLTLDMDCRLAGPTSVGGAPPVADSN